MFVVNILRGFKDADYNRRQDWWKTMETSIHEIDVTDFEMADLPIFRLTHKQRVEIFKTLVFGIEKGPHHFPPAVFDGSCVLAQKAVDASGNLRMELGGTKCLADMVTYTILKAKDWSDVHARASCRVPFKKTCKGNCINPEHLLVASRRQIDIETKNDPKLKINASLTVGELMAKMRTKFPGSEQQLCVTMESMRIAVIPSIETLPGEVTTAEKE